MSRSKRREFTNTQKAEMNKRAMDDAGVIRCEGCGVALKKTQVEHDHIVPEALRTAEDKEKKITTEEGQVLGRDCCHRGEGSKTSRDQRAIAKAKRQEKKNMGAVKPKGEIASRGFAGGKKPKAPKGDPFEGLPRRQLFERR